MADKRIHTFPKNSKVNVIAWLKFQLAFFEAAVQHVNHYVTGNLLESFFWFEELVTFETYARGIIFL